MSGPNVVDKAKMVFHYVAKISTRPSNSNDIPESNAGREMKVCFRHSKHSIKCDINAPCLECDSGLKLYSYEQCRRHLDVVRSEKRFESIEVDRSENMIEKLSDIDENGKKMSQLLEMIASKQDIISKTLSDLSSTVNESQKKCEILTTHPKHENEEERISRETMNCSLKEISKNTLKSQKKNEDICDKLNECHSVLLELIASGNTVNSNHVLGHCKLSEVNSNLTVISEKIAENTTHLKGTTDSFSKALNDLQTNSDKLFDQISQMKTFVVGFETSLKQELSCLRNDLRTELQLTRNELIQSREELRSELTTAITAVKDEIQSLKELSQTFANDLKDTLPEKLMDVFGSILMLSADNSRKMDVMAGEECGTAIATANSSFSSQLNHLNNKNEY